MVIPKLTNVFSRFDKKVLEDHPDFFVKDGFFFSKKFKHILRGFYCEKKSSHAQLWRVLCPLFDSSKILNLTYSKVLQGGNIDYKVTPKKELSGVLSNTISNFESNFDDREIEELIDYIESNSELLRNPNIGRTYAKALLLIGRVKDARSQFRNCMAGVSQNIDPNIHAECMHYLAHLSSEDNGALTSILMEEENKANALGIDQRR